MRVLQLRQRLRSNSHETTGMLSYGLIGWSQPGQCDGGGERVSPPRSRQTTTLRNDPMIRPMPVTQASSNASTGSASPSLMSVSPGPTAPKGWLLLEPPSLTDDCAAGLSPLGQTTDNLPACC